MAGEGTLVLDGLLGFVTALAFAFTGRALARRPVEGDARAAALAFAAWWGATSVVTALLGLARILAGLGLLTPSLLETNLHLVVLATCFGFACLAYYLLFAATGWKGLAWPLGAGYAAFYALTIGFLAWWDPIGHAVSPWSLHIVYATTPAGWPFWLVVALLFLPPFLAVACYLRLYPHARSPTQRYRIALVSTSVLVLMASGVVASEVGVPRLDGLYPASRVAALAATVGILLAYVPPTWVQRRFRVQSVQEESQDAA